MKGNSLPQYLSTIGRIPTLVDIMLQISQQVVYIESKRQPDMAHFRLQYNKTNTIYHIYNTARLAIT